MLRRSHLYVAGPGDRLPLWTKSLLLAMQRWMTEITQGNVYPTFETNTDPPRVVANSTAPLYRLRGALRMPEAGGHLEFP